MRGDFVACFQEEYDIQCEDENCYVLYHLDKDDDSRHNTFWRAEGYYDNSTGFLGLGMETKRLYRNADDVNRFFSIEVKRSFLGDFEVIDTRQNKVNYFTD
jgi:hypothetical protein